MNTTARIVFAALALGVALPVTAQEPTWTRRLERDLERASQRLEGVFEARLEAQEQGSGEVRRRREEVLRRRAEMIRQRQEMARQRRNAARQGPGLTEQFTRTVRIGRDGTFELTNASGNVVVTGGGGDEVRIDAVKHVWNPNETEAKALLQELQVQITERTGQVDVRTVLPDRRKFISAAVDYTIAVPSGAAVAVRSVSGDVRITNVRGELRAETVSGNVITSSVGRLRTVKSVSGDIQIEDAEGADSTVSTVNGAINARNLKTRAIDATSVSGDVRFTDVESDRVSMRSLNGDIEYAGRLARNGRYEMQAHSGDIRVTPSNNNGFDVEAGTLTGDVRSDFALTLGSRSGGSGGGRGARLIRGSFGDGGASLLLRSFNGDITIVKR